MSCLYVSLDTARADAPALDVVAAPVEASPDFRILAHGYRFAWFDQDGRGYQSQAGTWVGPGSEALRVLQPAMFVRAAQGDDVVFDLSLQVDVVTSASADALDAVTTASRTNEAGTLELATTWRASEDDVVALRIAAHLEEPLRSGSLGLSYTHELAEDNATFSLSFNGTVDRFDTIQPNGFTPGIGWRQSWNGNVALSQVLSRTTVGTISYGVTNQRGMLQQTWNSSPITPCGVEPLCSERAEEIFPRTRIRHAVRASLAQRIVPTETTLRLGYRFYADDFDVRASTFEGEVIQALGDVLGLTLRYRYHHQSAVSFFSERLPSEMRLDFAPRTSDSDLDLFTSQSLGARLDFTFPGRRRAGTHGIDVSYGYYFRTNDLDVHLLATGYRRVY